MAVPHGSAATLSLDNSSGSPIALTGYMTEVNFSPEIKTHLTTVMGNTSESRIVGLKDGKFTASFKADPTLTAHLIGLWNAQTPGSATTWSFIIGPNGSTSGFQRMTGECYLTSFPIISSHDAERNITASFECSGNTTFDTF